VEKLDSATVSEGRSPPAAITDAMRYMTKRAMMASRAGKRTVFALGVAVMILGAFGLYLFRTVPQVVWVDADGDGVGEALEPTAGFLLMEERCEEWSIFTSD
jgi:hypothetical protein